MLNQSLRKFAVAVGLIVALAMVMSVNQTVYADVSQGYVMSPEKINAVLKKAYKDYRNIKEGKNADYIPALAEVEM